MGEMGIKWYACLYHTNHQSQYMKGGTQWHQVLYAVQVKRMQNGTQEGEATSCDKEKLVKWHVSTWTPNSFLTSRILSVEMPYVCIYILITITKHIKKLYKNNN